MSSFLNRMKGKFNEAAARASGAGPTGHVLGSEDAQGNHVFSVTFTKQKLGLTVTRAEDGRAVVTALTDSGEAQRMRVQRGDTVVQLEGEDVTDYAAFMEVLPSLPRPVTVTFLRGGRNGTMTAAPARPGRVESGGVGGAGEAARAQRLAAAEARQAKYDSFTQTKRGNGARRQAGTGAAAPKPDTAFKDSTDPQVLAAMARARRAEEEEIRRQGYNPYEAKSMSSAQASAIRSAGTVGEGAAPASPGAPRPLPGSGQGRVNRAPAPENASPAIGQPPAAEPPDEWEAALDAACVALSEHPDREQVAATTTLLLKILRNVRDKAHGDGESKFRRLRMSNPALAEKVLGVDGGLALMVAAGFDYDEEDDGVGVLRFPHLGTANYVPLGAAITRLEGMAS